MVVRCPPKLEELPYDVEQAAALYAATHSGAPPGNRVAVVMSRCKFLRRVPGALGRVMMASGPGLVPARLFTLLRVTSIRAYTHQILCDLCAFAFAFDIPGCSRML